MSKLEDKLTASIKPAGGKTAPARSAARPRPAKPPAQPKSVAHPKPAAQPGSDRAPEATDLNAPAPPLHPRRIWPD